MDGKSKSLVPPPVVPPRRKRKPMGMASYVEFQTVTSGIPYSVERLNEWGREGWELAGVTSTNGILTTIFHYVFQRKE